MDGATRLVSDLVDDDPVVAELYEWHVENNDGLLPHVFFGELRKAAVDAHLGVPDEDLDVEAFLRSLERHYHPDDEAARGVVLTSFLVDLPFPGQPGHDIADRLGPVLRAEFELVRPHG
jgi:hypothetical protein